MTAKTLALTFSASVAREADRRQMLFNWDSDPLESK